MSTRTFCAEQKQKNKIGISLGLCFGLHPAGRQMAERMEIVTKSPIRFVKILYITRGWSYKTRNINIHISEDPNSDRYVLNLQAPCVLYIGQAFHYSLENAFYTGCNRRNGPDFGRVFLKSYYTDMTQNTYIQSSMVTEILAGEVWNIDSYYSLIDY